MGNSMPLSLVASWVVFFGFVNTHQRHARHFRGESQGYLRALQASVLLGSLVGLGLLGYYFTQVAWYMPIALFAIGSLVGGASVWCAGCKNQSAWHEHLLAGLPQRSGLFSSFMVSTPNIAVKRDAPKAARLLAGTLGINRHVRIAHRKKPCLCTRSPECTFRIPND